MTQPEARLYKRCKRYIEKKGGRCFKIHGGDNPFQEVGIPDLLCCYKGYFIALETKLKLGERPSPIQRKLLKDIERAGGVARTITSVSNVDAILLAIDRRKVGL